MGKLTRLAGGLTPLPPRIGFVDEQAMPAWRKRDTAAPWRQWYRTPEWRKLRWSILVRDLFTCRMCGRIEADTSKLVADHIEPHRGDRTRFTDPSNLQCLCRDCHSGLKQEAENAGRFTR